VSTRTERSVLTWSCTISLSGKIKQEEKRELPFRVLSIADQRRFPRPLAFSGRQPVGVVPGGAPIIRNGLARQRHRDRRRRLQGGLRRCAEDHRVLPRSRTRYLPNVETYIFRERRACAHPRPLAYVGLEPFGEAGRLRHHDRPAGDRPTGSCRASWSPIRPTTSGHPCIDLSVAPTLCDAASCRAMSICASFRDQRRQHLGCRAGWTRGALRPAR